MSVSEIAMMGGLTYETIRAAIFTHPTYAEALTNCLPPGVIERRTTLTHQHPPSRNQPMPPQATADKHQHLHISPTIYMLAFADKTTSDQNCYQSCEQYREILVVCSSHKNVY